MRVVHTFFKYPPAIGGHELYVQQLAEGLRARGYDARVLSSKLRVHARSGARAPGWQRWLRRARGVRPDADTDGYELLDAAYEEVGGVPVTRLEPVLPVTRRVELAGFKQALRALQPDLIHAHDIWRAPFEASLEVAAELGVPIFLNPVFHDRSHERHARRWAGVLERVAAKVPADAQVFFNTPWEREQLERCGVRFERSDLLPPSLDLEELERIPAAPVEGVPGERLLVSFVGRLNPEKGADVALESFARALAELERRGDPRAGRAHLVLAGFRDSAVDYPARARALGVGERVSLLSDRPRADVVNLLRQSSIFVLPSKVETFGIVVIEAWATGNLALVQDHWALPYVVRDGHDGVVCRDGEWPERLVHALQHVDDAWGRRLVENGRRSVRERYERRGRIDQLVGCIESATGVRPARADS